MSLRKLLFAFLAVLFLSFTVQPLMAQSQNISGSVVDSTGATVPGAAITVTDSAKGEVVRNAESDNNGHFEAINIQPGNYVIAVEKPGFKKAEVPVKLDVNAKVDIGQVKLEVGQVTEVMSVEGLTSPVVQVNTMEKAYLVDQTQMSQLPMNGRNWTALMSTLPGMSSAAQSDFNVNFNDVSQFHGLGGRGSENNFYLDGTPNVDVGDNQSQYTQPSIDSIAEFRVLQSAFNAEYGRNEGLAVAVQTKSGGAKFHGTLYEYFRNNALDAKCVLCNTLEPQLRYNQFGGNISGWVPIPKLSTPANKKIFFFYNREMTRRNLPSSSYADVPDAQILSGNFSQWLTSSKMKYAPAYNVGTVFEPGTVTRDGSGNITGGTPFPNNSIPASMINQQGAALMKLYQNIPGYASLPAAPNPGYSRYYYNNPDALTKNQDVLRIDYAVSSKVTSFFRWVNDYQKEQIQTGIWTGEPFPIQPQVRPKPGSSWSWNLVTTFTPTLASETVLSYNHQSQSLSVVGNNPVSKTALGATFPELYPATNITNTIPNITFDPIPAISFGDPGWHNWGKDYGVTENLTKVAGSHTFKFGFFYDRDNKAQTATWPQNATLNFDSTASMPLDSGTALANLLLGNFNSYSEPSAAIFPYFRFESAEAYAQDSWKITKRLTMEIGLRFEHMVPTFTYTRSGTAGGEGTWTLYSVDLSKYNASLAPSIDLTNGKIIGNAYNQLSQLGLVCDPCKGTPRGFSPAKNMFAPRLGFAYDLFGNGKTALRAGFGIFHERLRQNAFSFGAGASWPNLSSASQVNGNLSAIDLSVTQGTPAIQPPNLTIWSPSNTMPSIYSWYAGIQHELPRGYALDISYSGNHSVHLMDERYVNGLPAGTFLTNPNLVSSVNGFTSALRPYLGWGQLNAVETNAYARYNAMMARLTKRFGDSLSANFNYTWSKTMDLLDNDTDVITNPFNMRQNWANAGYNQPQVFSTDIVYNLPKFAGNRFNNAFTRTAFNGWELTGIFRAQSGMPFNLTSNGNLYGIDTGTQYVNLIGNPYSGQTSSQWLNVNAFARPADGSYGNLHRNTLRLPAVQNFDASIMKNFAVGEWGKITFRAEVFNVLNHPQVWAVNTSFVGDNPGSTISSTDNNLGQPSQWRDPRILQLALRFAF